jgi:hypothetical protein
MDNSEMSIASVADSSKSQTSKVDTLVLNTYKAYDILEMIHSASIDVENLELDFSGENEEPNLENIRSIVSLLEKRYQAKIRKLVVNNNPLLKLLLGLSCLKLRKLRTYFDLDRKCMCDFISRQSTITDLEVTCIVDHVLLEYAFRNLPLLNVMDLTCHYLDDIRVFSGNSHHLRTLTCLNLDFDNYLESEGLDITFIAKIPNLQKFSCSFSRPPQFLKLAPIKNPMVNMKEFDLSTNADIDGESMWNIFHKMPNLEKFTFHEQTAKVCGVTT